MKTELRVTKYNPIFRDESGAYRKDEWTSISDIGKLFEDGVLTESEYLTTENKYIEAIKSFFSYLKVKEVIVTSLEKYSEDGIEERFLSPFRKVSNGASFEVEDADDLIRLNLRALLWCKLASPDAKAEVEFGYDYYMYFATEEDIRSQLISMVNKIGLFAE